jgi:prophage DNA circulation protein
MFVQTVEIDIATVLVNELEKNQVAFEDGIKAINEKIQVIDNTVNFLNLLERGLNILGRIIDLTI